MHSIFFLIKKLLTQKNVCSNIRNVERHPKEMRAFSSVGRASPLQGEGQKFESFNAHHKKDRKKAVFFSEK